MRSFLVCPRAISTGEVLGHEFLEQPLFVCGNIAIGPGHAANHPEQVKLTIALRKADLRDADLRATWPGFKGHGAGDDFCAILISPWLVSAEITPRRGHTRAAIQIMMN
jgi:hypothetical protein